MDSSVVSVSSRDISPFSHLTKNLFPDRVARQTPSITSVFRIEIGVPTDRPLTPRGQ
jgi:hypothetical protein